MARRSGKSDDRECRRLPQKGSRKKKSEDIHFGSSVKLSKTYAADVEMLCTFLKIDLDDLHRVTRGDVLRWMTSMEKEGVAPNTIRRRIYGVAAIFRALCSKGVLNATPVVALQVPKPTGPLAKVEPMTENEVTALLCTPASDTPKGLRDRAILSLMALGGLRLNEIRSLTRDDVTLKNGKPVQIEVRGKSATTAIELSQEIRECLSEYLQNVGLRDPRAPLFSPIVNRVTGTLDKELSSMALFDLVKAYAKAAGVDEKRASFSALRAYVRSRRKPK